MLLSLLSTPAPLDAQAPIARQVAAPASDILDGVVRLPDPASTPTVSGAAILPLEFAPTGTGWAAEVLVPVEREGRLALGFLGAAAANWRILGGPTAERPRPLEELAGVERTLGFAGEFLPGWIVDRRDVSPVAAGTWRVRVESPTAAEGWLVASVDRELRLSTHVTTQRLVSGTGVALVARVDGVSLGAVARARVLFKTTATWTEVAMADDGAHEDGGAGDGLFGAFVPDSLLGDVTARVELGGALITGAGFVRSAFVAFPMHSPRLLLDGTVRAALNDPGRLTLALGAAPLGAPQRLHVSAEVWGRDALGAEAPVCWLSKILTPSAVHDGWELPLSLDLDWLEAAGVGSPLELRAVRVQDPDSEAVLDQVERAVLTRGPGAAAPAPVFPARPASGVVTSPMLTGDGATTLGPSGGGSQNFAAQRALMLVHGYCSSGSIWPAADFTQPKLEFLDPNANRSHDQFAQLIAQRAVAAKKASFGIVGHSQGGPAAMHLLTYYASGLGSSTAGRRIQSVAAPYQGTPLASWGGFACGVNNNMTPSGSATWLSGIPTWARAEVFTWTTANSGSACNFITGLLLTDPEDGTVEKVRSELPGGNNMGHTVGWCHTTGMSNPANYTDGARNVLLNAAAAR